MENNDPNNTLGNPNPTHINAYYADLAVAENELALANGKVQAARDAIVANGGTLPGADEDAEDITVDGDKAQLAEDEATDVADDAAEPAESDEAPVTPTDVPATDAVPATDVATAEVTPPADAEVVDQPKSGK